MVGVGNAGFSYEVEESRRGVSTATQTAKCGQTGVIPTVNVTFLNKLAEVTLGQIKLNKCGVYMVECDASAEATTTIQLYKDGVAVPQAQSTGGTPAFVTLVQVLENNCCCPCASPVSLQIMNETAATFTDVNVCVTKLV